MAKINKEHQARIEGMQYALDYVKKHGIEELEKEVHFRCNNKLPLTTSREMVEEYQEIIKENMLSTVSLMAVLILREEFGFGATRLSRFTNKFKANTEQLKSGDLTWRDAYEAMVEEVGFSIGIDDDILDMQVIEK